MSSQGGVGLPEALERAASALPKQANAIRPANGDPTQLLELLDAAGAARVLRWLLTEEPAEGAELIDAWLEDPERGAAIVLGIAAGDLPKPARKALRRAHHQLRSRGVAVPEACPAPTLATLPRVADAIDEAILSPLDPGGGRAAYLVTSHPQGGVRMFELLLDETRGVLECRVYNTGRSKVRKFLKQFERPGALAAVPAPPDAVRALVRRVADAHPSDRPLPRGFREWRGQLGSAPQGQATPGELAREALGVPGGPAPVRRAAELLRRGEFGPWPPNPEALAPLAEQLEALGSSTIVVSPAQRREQLDGVLEEALPGLFAAPFAEQTAARLEETAYVLWKRGRDDDARACLGAARAFREDPVAENPVARAMLDVALGPVLAKLDEPGPGDAAPDESAP